MSTAVMIKPMSTNRNNDDTDSIDISVTTTLTKMRSRAAILRRVPTFLPPTDPFRISRFRRGFFGFDGASRIVFDLPRTGNGSNGRCCCCSRCCCCGIFSVWSNSVETTSQTVRQIQQRLRERLPHKSPRRALRIRRDLRQ